MLICYILIYWMQRVFHPRFSFTWRLPLRKIGSILFYWPSTVVKFAQPLLSTRYSPFIHIHDTMHHHHAPLWLVFTQAATVQRLQLTTNVSSKFYTANDSPTTRHSVAIPKNLRQSNTLDCTHCAFTYHTECHFVVHSASVTDINSEGSAWARMHSNYEDILNPQLVFLDLFFRWHILVDKKSDSLPDFLICYRPKLSLAGYLHDYGIINT